MTDTLEREKMFARYLTELNEGEDRAALAALRRGLGRAPGEAGEMHRYVVPRVQGLSSRQEDAYYIVAALYALHPSAGWSAADDGKQHKTNLGASLGCLKDESASVERRFVALLNCHRDELPQHLRQIVSLLKANDAPVDWAQLIHDINHWDSEQRFVQRNWARAFWSSDEANANNAQSTPDEQTATS